MDPLAFLAGLIAADPGRGDRRSLTGRGAVAAFGPAEFLGQPAEACRFPAQRVRLEYIDGEGEESVRLVTADEVIRYRSRLYLSAYCHERFDRRHLRFDRIVAMHRFADGEAVDPADEIAHWTERA